MFSGRAFFLTQRVPLRTRYADFIKANGGTIAWNDKQADIIIAVHPSNAPPGAVSWKYIENAIQTSVEPDINDYLLHPRKDEQNTSDSVIEQTKTKRTPFSDADDKLLIDWVTSHHLQGGALNGNEIYKQLATKNVRHTYHSWRDRWVKHLSHHTKLPPLPSAKDIVKSVKAVVKSKPLSELKAPVPQTAKLKSSTFSNEEFEALLAEAEYIELLTLSEFDNALKHWVKKYPKHKPEEWFQFYREVVKPHYLKTKAFATRKGNGTNGEEDSAAEEPEDLFQDAREAQQPEEVVESAPEKVVKSAPDKVVGMAPGEVVERAPEIVIGAASDRVASSNKRPAPNHSPQPTKKLRVDAPLPQKNTNTPPKTPVRIPSARHTLDDDIYSLDGSVIDPPNSILENPQKFTALTTANLAQMQAEQSKPKQHRGLDLIEDDVDADQSAFAKELGNLVRGRVNGATLKPPPKNNKSRSRTSPSEIPESPSGVTETQDRDSDVIASGSEDLGMTPRAVKGSSIHVPYLSSPSMNGHVLSSPVRPELHEDLVLDHHPTRATASRNAFAQMAAMGKSYNFTELDKDQSHESPRVEIDLPEPAGGFFSHLSSEGPESGHDYDDDDYENIDRDIRRGIDLSTQAIYDAQTQEVDYDAQSHQIDHDLSDPYFAGDDQIMRRRSGQLHNDISPHVFANDIILDLNEYIDNLVSKGFKEEHVLDAVHSSSMLKTTAEIVLEFLKQGKSIPKGLSGIWTEEEDKALQSTDAEVLLFLERKHGPAHVNRRVKYLESLH